MIQIGDTLPQATFTVMGPDGPAKTTTDEYFGGRKVALFAVPGAFTPTCQEKHLPSFRDARDEFSAKGVDAVACVAVNDVFVLGAWAKQTGTEGKIDFLSDGNAEFAKALGLDFDGSKVGLGTRSKRYAMIVDDKVVRELKVEESPGEAKVSTADKLLAAL